MLNVENNVSMLHRSMFLKENVVHHHHSGILRVDELIDFVYF
jgi:hypothetical protein